MRCRPQFGPRGVLHTWSDGKGGQWIEDTGLLSRARMPTVDLEIYDAANKFMDAQVKAQKGGSTPRGCTFGRTSSHLRRDAPESGSIPTACTSMTTWRAGGSPGSMRSPRQQRHRCPRHRQWRGDGNLAGRRDHPVPRREGDHLGRWLPRTHARALAGCDQAGHDRQRNLLAGRLAAGLQLDASDASDETLATSRRPCRHRETDRRPDG